MESSYFVAYVAVAVLAIAASFTALVLTKSPVIVATISASVAAMLFMVYARIDIGYWDPFAPIAFGVCWGYAFLISIGFLGIGRFLGQSFFIKKLKQPPVSQ